MKINISAIKTTYPKFDLTSDEKAALIELVEKLEEMRAKQAAMRCAAISCAVICTMARPCASCLARKAGE